MKKNAFTGIEVLIVLAVIGVGTWLAKPALFPGASKRAAESTQATARVEEATNAQGSAAAASVAKIGEANAEAPASPSKDFITKEVPVALSLLPAPDAAKLIDAERRKSAVMEGRAEEARRLYEAAAKQSERLQHERDQALAARHAADLALEQAAAAEHARTVQAFAALAVAALGLAGWAYAKIYGISPASLGKMAADIRAGVNPLQALDTHTAPHLFERVRNAAKLAAP